MNWRRSCRFSFKQQTEQQSSLMNSGNLNSYMANHNQAGIYYNHNYMGNQLNNNNCKHYLIFLRFVEFFFVQPQFIESQTIDC
jgi:hypothetical protein